MRLSIIEFVRRADSEAQKKRKIKYCDAFEGG
jgi:hypothetical protein